MGELTQTVTQPPSIMRQVTTRQAIWTISVRAHSALNLFDVGTEPLFPTVLGCAHGHPSQK
jgi:hypothetical protein